MWAFSLIWLKIETSCHYALLCEPTDCRKLLFVFNLLPQWWQVCVAFWKSILVFLFLDVEHDLEKDAVEDGDALEIILEEDEDAFEEDDDE